jgi:hypothetical protein
METLFTGLPRELATLAIKREIFPVASLTPLLANAVTAICDFVDCPPGLAAASVLSAASLAVQGHFNVLIPATQIFKPVSLFLLSIAESGERKTTADGMALAPVGCYEQELDTAYKEQLTSYRRAEDVYVSAYKRIVNDHNIPPADKTARIVALGLQPESPIRPVIICGEPTIEGLLKNLQVGRPSQGIFSDEGGAFVGGYGMNQDNRLKTASYLNSLWDGSTAKRVRADPDETFMLPGRRLTIHLMIQPSVALKLFGMEDIRTQGLFSRLLISYPESRIGTRWQHEHRPESQPNLDAYHRQLWTILHSPLPVSSKDPRILSPATIRLSTEATDLWERFADDVEERMLDGNEYAFIRGFASKMSEHACRVAAVMQMFDAHKGYAYMIDEKMFECARRITEHYASQLMGFHASSDDNEELEDAKKFLAYLQEKYKHQYILERDINITGPNCIRGKKNEERRNRIIAKLEQAGWLAEIPPEVIVREFKRRATTRVWEIYRNK